MVAPLGESESRPEAGDGKEFPPEVYLAQDDITPEAVALLRKKAAKKIEASQWDIVDGFGLSTAF